MAIMEVLQAETATVSVPTAMDSIMARVRAEAARIGVTQTPVMLGYVEGGLVLPALHAGRRYYEAFPEAHGVRVGHDIADLSAFTIPAPVLRGWTARFPS